MQLGESILLGVALAMDAFAVSAASAMTLKKIRPADLLLLAGAFGFFQGIMPLIGYFAGSACAVFTIHLASPLACLLLCLVGGKMLADSLLHPAEAIICLTPRLVLLQAVATSIDALAVGVSLAAAGVNLAPTAGLNIWQAAGVIAACTFILCLLAGSVGRLLAARSAKPGVIGGLILIGIGLKMLL